MSLARLQSVLDLKIRTILHEPIFEWLISMSLFYLSTFNDRIFPSLSSSMIRFGGGAKTGVFGAGFWFEAWYFAPSSSWSFDAMIFAGLTGDGTSSDTFLMTF